MSGFIMYNKSWGRYLLNEFKRLKDILVAENDGNWIRGVEVIIEKT